MKLRRLPALAAAGLAGFVLAGVTFADGTVDPSFGNAGVVSYATASSNGNAVAQQPDGKILLAGSAGNALFVARYDSYGSLDTSFGSGGSVTLQVGGNTTNATSLVLQPDGKIVVAGQAWDATGDNRSFLVARLNADGSFDSSFGTAGVTTVQVGTRGTVRALVLQPDGKIVAAGDTFDQGTGGHELGLLRLNADGTLDTSFGSSGVVELGGGSGEFGYGVVRESNGDLVVVGQHNASRGSAWIIDSAGSLMSTVALSSMYGACGVVVLPSGSLVVAGSNTAGTGLALARLAADGTVDSSYPSVTPTASGGGTCGLTAESDGSVDVGTSHGSFGAVFAAGHFDATGAPDPAFGTDGFAPTTLTGTVNALARQSDGELLVAGTASISGANHAAIVRVAGVNDSSAGTTSTSTTTTTTATPPASAGALVQLDAPNDCIAETSTAGCGSVGKGLNGADWVAISPDGKNVYVASFAGNSVAEFARNADGSLTQLAGANACIATTGSSECTTTPGLGYPSSVAVSPDGKNVYVTGSNDDTVVAFTRNADGSLSPLACLQDSAATYNRCATKVVGLRNAYDVTVSADGKNVYVAAGGSGNVLGDVAEFARASDGSLTQLAAPNDCIEETGDATPVCGTTTGTGLTALTALAVTPSGQNVYGVADDDPGAVSEFTRNADGSLTELGCIGKSGSSECATTSGGLADLVDVAVSPDGGSVYVVSDVLQGVVGGFSVGSGGALTAVGCAASAAAGCAWPATGTASAFGVALSPDSANVYVASAGSSTHGIPAAVASFARGSDSALTQLPPPDDCTQSASGTTCSRTGTGLADALSLVVSPDGLNAYAAASVSGSGGAVVEFGRSPSTATTTTTTTATTTTAATTATTTAPTTAPTTTAATTTTTAAPVETPPPTTTAATTTTTVTAPHLVAQLAASPTVAARGTRVTLTAGGSSPARSYTFTFGDGTRHVTTTTTPKTSHSYARAGVYEARVIVTDANGTSAAASTRITVTARMISVSERIAPHDAPHATAPVRVGETLPVAATAAATKK